MIFLVIGFIAFVITLLVIGIRDSAVDLEDASTGFLIGCIVAIICFLCYLATIATTPASQLPFVEKNEITETYNLINGDTCNIITNGVVCLEYKDESNNRIYCESYKESKVDFKEGNNETVTITKVVAEWDTTEKILYILEPLKKEEIKSIVVNAPMSSENEKPHEEKSSEDKNESEVNSTMSNYCTGCGNELDTVWNFCGNCGEKIEE